jgi:hypothetical protein
MAILTHLCSGKLQPQQQGELSMWVKMEAAHQGGNLFKQLKWCMGSYVSVRQVVWAAEMVYGKLRTKGPRYLGS